jgi:hypothetical protein
LVATLAASKPRGRAANYLASRYDELYTPRSDQLVAFDALVDSIKSNLESFAMETASPEAERLQLQLLKTALQAPNNGVFVNVRALHAAAVDPASFGTKLNALKAILSVNHFLMTRKLLYSEGQRELFNQGPTGKAFLDICRSLSAPERKMALDALQEELGPQAVVFEKNAVFLEQVEGYELLLRGAEEAMPLQAMPVSVVPEPDSQGMELLAEEELIEEDELLYADDGSGGTNGGQLI